MKISLIGSAASVNWAGRGAIVRRMWMTVPLSHVFMEAAGTSWLGLSAFASLDSLVLSALRTLMIVKIMHVNMEEPVRMDPTHTSAYVLRTTGVLCASE